MYVYDDICEGEHSWPQRVWSEDNLEEPLLSCWNQAPLPKEPSYRPERPIVRCLDKPLGQSAEKVSIWLPWRTGCEKQGLGT